MPQSRFISIISLLAIFMMVSCRTYYQKSIDTEQALLSQNYEKAEASIQSNKFLKRKRNLLLYHLELGRIKNLQGDYEASNKHLNKADYMMEEFRNFFDMAAGVTVNASIQSYQAASHEQILVHYFKAINYIKLGDLEEALVEVRRIDLKQAKNNHAVSGKLKKYGKDPFGLMLMGMIYEADGDYNNAFIAYRNAQKVYDEDQTGLYSRYPFTLEEDLARTAAMAGMTYPIKTTYDHLENGELILFWENGLAPIKEEKNIIFSLNQNNQDYYFESDDLQVPVDYDFSKDDPNFNPSDIGTIRLAIPYYVPRPFGLRSATVTHNKQPVRIEQISDITGLAFQIERDNYLKELGKNLLRITLKKISELALTEQNEYAGFALGVANFATEKADTRNWQSLPGEIQYTRIPLEEGTNVITISFNNGEKKTFEVEGNGQRVFEHVVTY